MDVGLVIAGAASVALAGGHEVVGLAAVLRTIPEERLAATVFGPPSMTAAIGGILLTFASSEERDPQVVVLRWLAAMWLAATAVALWEVRRCPKNALRLPVPFVWPVVALLCWRASL